jgi:hypothetical protein
MADSRVDWRSRTPASQPLGIALVLALLLFLPGAADALQLDLQFPARSIVDKPSGETSGNYFTGANSFTLTLDSEVGNQAFLTLKDFFIPDTSVIFNEFESFAIEDPANPGSFAATQDVPLIWDRTTGRIESDGAFRTELTFHAVDGSTLVSFFDLVLTTAGTSPIFCPSVQNPVNFHGAISGLDLPAGSLPGGGAPVKFAAAACPVTEAGVQNDLANTIALLEISGTVVPEPGAGLLLSTGLLVGLACLRRVRRR